MSDSSVSVVSDFILEPEKKYIFRMQFFDNGNNQFGNMIGLQTDAFKNLIRIEENELCFCIDN